MQFLVEILKLAEASVQSDRKKAIAYASQLADKLDQSGEVKAAARLRRVISSGSASVSPASTSIAERLPVDSESRLSLADEVMVRPGDVEIFLDEHVQSVLDEFIRYVSASDKLIAEGVGVAPSLIAFGPPGCGKTEMARLIASRLGLPLITARTDTLISSYLGSTAKNLRLLFDHAASRPCVLFLDEFDAIAKLRDDRFELGELKRVVVSLLQNIDAIQGHTVLLAATNHEHLLDPAIWRRFAYRVKIDLPAAEARACIFKRFLGEGAPSKAIQKFAEASDGLSGSDIKEVCEAARREQILSGDGGFSEVAVLKRLLFRTAKLDGLSLADIFMRAKELHPSVYTHRVLGEAFEMTAGNVTHILNKKRQREEVQS